MKLFSQLKSLFTRLIKPTKERDPMIGSFDPSRMRYVINYKSKLNIFDKTKLAAKYHVGIIRTSDEEQTKETIEDAFSTINWSRVSYKVKDQCIQLAKKDIESKI